MMRNAMKTIKRHTEKVTKLYTGQTVDWQVPFFDGRTTEHVPYEGTVVKVNKVTVDVALPNQDVVRLDLRQLKVTPRPW
jgi:hypothetical protein